MQITGYSFGKIQVDGKNYNSDIKIIGSKIVTNWWRRDGHSLCIEDISDIISTKPEVFVMGCGSYGVLKVPAKLKEKLKELSIELLDLNTDKAVKEFNSIANSGKKIAAGFHLTC